MKVKVYAMLVFLPAVAWMLFGSAAYADQKPQTLAELAMYRGADRQQILEAGAKKEGKLTFYTTGILTQTVRPIVKAFEKKYPFIKVDIWRGGTRQIVPRVSEEYRAGKHVVDVMELTQSGEILMEERGILQPFYSPQLEFIEEGALKKAPGGGAFSAGHYQSGISLGYNTRAVKEEELPKTYEDLLDPKWKGKMAMVTSNTGITWIGALFENKGEAFLKKVLEQQITTHSVSGRALLDLLIAGEHVIAPTILDSHVRKSKNMGAPVDWVPLEPVPVYIGQVMLAKHAAHPHAALLFLDHDLSKEGGELYKANGYNSPRTDIYVERRYKKYPGPWSSEQVKKWSVLFNRMVMKR